MRVSYKNEIGEITMGGGSHPVWNIIEITGLGAPPKAYNATPYVNQPGQKTTSEKVLPRTVTISGDIVNDNQLYGRISGAIKILDRPGILTVDTGINVRKIPCRTNAPFETPDRNGAAQPFILQLVADNPYFESMRNTTISVFRREKLLKGTFTFPKVFSRRINEADIKNLGDVSAEPVFYIQNISGGTGSESDHPIRIINHTTGVAIELMYSSGNGEKITIDIPRRTITSNIQTEDNNNGNLIGFISDDTFLNLFKLEKGLNHLEAGNLNAGEDIAAVCEFTNQYLEAMY